MDQRRSTGLAAGLILILIGVWFLAVQLIPALRGLGFHWPLIIVGVGVFLFLLGLVTKSPSLSIPAFVVGGIGGLLYWQFMTGRWASWSYAWALIPGFVGLGMIVAGLLGEKRSEMFRGGATLLVISLVLFVIFGSFLGGMFGLGQYWPLLLVLLGLFLLVQPFLFRKR
jgi:hypothetical protein